MSRKLVTAIYRGFRVPRCPVLGVRPRRLEGRGDPSSGISSADVLILPERYPACRQHEARSGSGTERENLTGDATEEGASGVNREAESTDAPERGGPPRSSEEGPVIGLEQRGWVIAADLGQLVRREEPFIQRKAAAFARWHEPDDARVSRPDL
jgi:hypothetical protein